MGWIGFDSRAQLHGRADRLFGVAILTSLLGGLVLIAGSLLPASRETPAIVLVIPVLCAVFMFTFWFGFDPYYVDAVNPITRRYIDGRPGVVGKLALNALAAALPAAFYRPARRVALALAGLSVLWLTVVTLLAGVGH